MALLKVKLPTGISYTRLIETIFTKYYGLPEVSIQKMLSVKQLETLLGPASTNNVKSFLITSPTIHGVEKPDGTIFIHPDPVYKRMASMQRGYLKKLTI